MKRAIAIVAAVFVLFAVAWYGFPQALKEPLVKANRSVSGLTEKQVRVGLHDIRYLEGGEGEAVVLLHGIFAEKDHWVDFARAFGDGYRIIVPDLPGFGESGRFEQESYAYAQQVQRLAALLDALGIRRAHLAGNSMGGTIAALFAVDHPERVASVTLVGAPHGIRSPRESEMDRQIAAGRAPLIARDEAEFEQMMSLVFARRPFLPYPVLHETRAEAIRNAQSNLRIWQQQLNDRFLLQTCVGRVKQPMLVMWGEEDRIFDVSGAEVLGTAAPHAQVHVLPGIGHLPMMEAPTETARLVRQFLGTVQRD